MRTPVRVIAWVLPLMLTACFHRSHPKPKDQVLAPPVQQPPVVEAASVPAEPPTQPGTAPTLQTLPPPAPQQAEEQPARPATHHRHTAPRNTPEEASNGSPAVSAVGQLSPGDSADLHSQAESTIAETERGLREINHPLNSQEQKTVAQIKEFLKQAKAALLAGDVDGANTLARKAKVLLGEIVH